MFLQFRCYLFAEAVFTAPYAGLQSIRVGSAHLNNVRAKRWDVATGCLKKLLQRACELEIDIIGVDLNQGATKSATHGLSPIQYAFQALKSNLPGPRDLLGPGTEDDCVGFLIVPGSNLWKSCTMTKVSYFCLLNNDIGLRRSDEGTHRPLVAHFRIPGEENRRQRTAASEQARKQRSTRARRERKRAAFGTSAATNRGMVLERISERDSDEVILEEEF
jgi:hypothetical protein